MNRGCFEGAGFSSDSVFVPAVWLAIKLMMMTACYLKDRHLVQMWKQDEVIDPEETFERTVTVTASSQSQSISHGSGATTPGSALRAVQQHPGV